jgi:hypothetical protein
MPVHRVYFLLFVVTLLILVPLGAGVWFGTTYQLQPWGILVGMGVGVLATTTFLVRHFSRTWRALAPGADTLREKEDTA